MERRYVVRFQELMEDAVVPPEQLDGLLSRLEQFVVPFAKSLSRVEQRRHCREYLTGLVSLVERKNVESIAYLHDQERRQLQKFIGECPWQDRPLIRELARQVGQEIGDANGVLVFDPSAFAKKGQQSVGVQRQWCGRLGKVENCQVGVYLAYASVHEHALVDVRLFLPEEWARDRKRRLKAGVPKTTRFRTRHQLAAGNARRTWRVAAPSVGQRRRRNGPFYRVSQGTSRARRALCFGRAVEYACEGSECPTPAPDTWSVDTQGTVSERVEVGRRVARECLGGVHRARRRERSHHSCSHADLCASLQRDATPGS